MGNVAHDFSTRSTKQTFETPTPRSVLGEEFPNEEFLRKNDNEKDVTITGDVKTNPNVCNLRAVMHATSTKESEYG